MTTPSWQSDPYHRHEYRWWDSQQWTEHVSDHGVAGIDPLSTPPAAPHATWAAPHLDPPNAIPETAVAVAAAPSPPGPTKRRGALIGAAAVLVLALGAGAFLLLRDDGPTTLGDTADPSTIVGATDVPPTTLMPTSAPATPAPTTPPTAPPTTVAATPAPTTIPPVSESDRLLAAMPTAADVPSDWVVYSDATSGHDPTVDTGVCDGPNNTGIAITNGSGGQVDGTTWDLPSGAWFGIEGYSFPSPEAASAFIIAVATQAAGCTTVPVTSQVPESDLEVFADPTDTVWQVDAYAATTPENAGIGDEVLLVSTTYHYGTVLDDGPYSFVESSERRLERYGSDVFEYWTSGQHDYVGFGNGAPDWVYTPTALDTKGATDTVRPTVQSRL